MLVVVVLVHLQPPTRILIKFLLHTSEGERERETYLSSIQHKSLTLDTFVDKLIHSRLLGQDNWVFKAKFGVKSAGNSKPIKHILFEGFWIGCMRGTCACM